MIALAAARCARNLPLFAVSLLVLLGFASIAAAERAPGRHKSSSHSPIRHDTTFKAVPGTKLQIRAVEYDGSTNGSLKVEVRNRDKVAHTFSAAGLYFVPDGDPDTAPQRLGAFGPLQLAGAATELTTLEVAPGATVEIALDVFCIDSHRASPSPQNKFTIGASRLPRELTRTIEKRADAAVSEARKDGAQQPRPAAKGKIQSEVWRSRDANWVELDGEGTQEAKKQRPSR